ncbi:hypothetical protein B0H42_003788 [Clostridium saccharobutylicum]|nr:hypothetical protein [Clostridium saccharobutylicum]
MKKYAVQKEEAVITSRENSMKNFLKDEKSIVY